MDTEEAQPQPEVDENGYRVDPEADPELEALFNLEEEFPEVEPRVYRDVEDLIFQGFLTLPAEIGSVSVVFKSLNHREMEMISWVAGGTSTKRYYDTFIAFSILMVDGRNLLADRDRRIPGVIQLFEDNLPEIVRSAIIRQLSELNRRAADALALTEAYAMERSSRWRWAQQKGTSFHSIAGVAGSETLGYNYAQLVWRALNYYEDQKEEAERQWDNAKFIGSCFAGKEIRKVYNQDKQRKKQEKRDRFVRRDQILQRVILGKEVTGSDGPMPGRIQIATTVEELTEQVRKSLAGEKDWHDEIVARAEEIDLQNKQKREQQRLEIIENARKTRELDFEEPTTRSFTREEVLRRTERFRQIAAQAAASRIVPMDEEEERRAAAGEKYLMDPSKER